MTGPFEIRPQARGTKPDDRTAEVLIYGDIGESWDDSTIAAKTFVKDLAALDADLITARINSYGGSVSDGVAIYNALRRHPAAVDMHIDGVAVSIASLIAMAGDTVTMPDNALMMIHAPWGASVGNARDMRDMADTLDKYAQAMRGAYTRAGVDPDQINAWLTDGNDHWLTADEAASAGLVDVVAAPLAIAASLPPRFRGQSRAQAAPTQTETPPMADTQETQAAAPEPKQPDTNITELHAKAKTDALAAIHARNAQIKTRFDALCRANQGRENLIRACYDNAIADLEQTPEHFTDTVLAKLAEAAEAKGESGPIVGAYSTRVDLVEDSEDKRKEAVALAQLARASIQGADGQRIDTAGNPYRGMKFTALARESLIRAGADANRVNRLDDMELVKAAFTQSTSDFPVLLENTMHKALLAGYAVESFTWSRICAVGSVSDFRAHNRYMIGSLSNLEAVTELNEFKNKAIGDGRKQSVQVSTKGNILNISRQAVVNDDMGALTGLSAAMGRAAARSIESDVYAAIGLNSGCGPTLSDGKTIIHADHGNIAATTGAPSVSTVEAGILKMAAQQDISGNDYLDLTPSIALVPKGLEMTTRQLNASTYDPAATGTSKNFMVPNPYNGFFADIVASQRLAATVWYMLASPAIAPVLEVSFLNGEQEPFLDMDEGFTVDGARYKIRLDYGVSGVGYEGIVYNAGT